MTTTPQAAEEAVPTSKIAKALVIIEKRPGIRSEDLARAMGIEARSIRAYIGKAMESGFVTTCKVASRSGPDTLEFRLQTGARAADWENHKFTRRAENLTKPLTPTTTVRRPGSEPKGTSKIGGDGPVIPPELSIPAAAAVAEATANVYQRMADHYTRKEEAALMETTIELAHWLNLGRDYTCETPGDLRKLIVSQESRIYEVGEHEMDSHARATQAEQTAENYARQKQKDDDALKVAKARIEELAEKAKNYEIRIAELQAELNRRLEGAAQGISAELMSRHPGMFFICTTTSTGEVFSKASPDQEEVITTAKEWALSMDTKSDVFAAYKIGTVMLKAEFVPIGEPA